MKTWVKVLLLCLLLAFLGAVGAGIALYRWLMGAVHEADTLAPAAQREGRDFAKHATQDGCVTEATNRASACTSIACEVAEKGFLQSCFAAATPDPAVCDGVPAQDKIVDSAKWAVAECQRRGHAGNQRCTRVVAELQALCAGKSARDGG